MKLGNDTCLILELVYQRTCPFDSAHPLYDAMKALCNPEGENSGHTAEYNGMTFQLYSSRDTYYDEQGIPQQEVPSWDLTNKKTDGKSIGIMLRN